MSSFSARSALFIDDFRQTVEAEAAAAGDPVGLPFIQIIAIALEMFAKFAPLMEMCKTPVPPTPPVPSALEAVGVSQETWHQAFVSKFGAEQSVQGDGFSKSAIRRATAEVRKSQNIKKKAAMPIAMAALKTGRDKSVEEIAIAAQSVKDNASQFGV